MTLKVKIIIAAVIVLITVVTVIGVFVYIDKLNDKITDLSVTIEDQHGQITALNCQIESLENNVESFRETINITNDYIANIEKVRSEEIITKQEIYETIVEDPIAKDWYEEKIPVSIMQALLNESNDLTCSD